MRDQSKQSVGHGGRSRLSIYTWSVSAAEDLEQLLYSNLQAVTLHINWLSRHKIKCKAAVNPSTNVLEKQMGVVYYYFSQLLQKLTNSLSTIKRVLTYRKMWFVYYLNNGYNHARNTGTIVIIVAILQSITCVVYSDLWPLECISKEVCFFFFMFH